MAAGKWPRSWRCRRQRACFIARSSRADRGLHFAAPRPRDRDRVCGASSSELKPNQVARLQELPAQRILAAYNTVERRLDSDAREKGIVEQHGLVPTVGVEALPSYPFDPVAPEMSADIPLLIGTNRHELALQTRSDAKIHGRTLTEEELRARVSVMAGNAADRVMQTCRPSIRTRIRPCASFLMATDRDLSPGFRYARSAQRRRRTGRRSSCTVRVGDAGGRRSASRPSRARDFVRVRQHVKGAGPTGGGPQAAALADKMSDAWIAFARTGNPNTPKLPKWPA